MSGLDDMKTRAGFNGYDLHDNLNVKGKYNSFQSALKNSYQAEWITVNRGKENEKRWRCLINASRLTENFDKKVLSIDFESGVQEGTVFWWDRTKRYWIVNLQQHTEEAYFRGTITRCDYELDIDGTTYWASVRGPVETATIWNQKHGINWNDLNYSMVIEITKNSQTIDYFTRHKVVKMKLSYPDINIQEMIEEWHNWKVVATDKYSSEQIIEVYLDEWYDNEMEDAMIVKEEPVVDETKPYIDGPSAIHVFDTDISFSVVGYKKGKFTISNSKVKITNFTDKSCMIDVLTTKASSFELKYTAEDGSVITKDVVIKSF